jgi:hypothetical protein
MNNCINSLKDYYFDRLLKFRGYRKEAQSRRKATMTAESPSFQAARSVNAIINHRKL